MRKSVLVTGGAGFLGSHLVDELLDRGYDVRVYDNLNPQVHPDGMPGYLAKNVEFIRGDIRDLDLLRNALLGVDAVFHLAAAVGVGQSMYEILHYMGVNTQGTATLLQAMLDKRCRVQKLIVASSMSIYGEGKYECADCGEVAPPPRSNEQLRNKIWDPQCPKCAGSVTSLPTDESKPLQCTSFYSLSKKDQEEMCLLFGRTYGIPVVALRYFNIFGTRQALSNPYTGVAAIFASRLLNGNPPLIFEDGKQMRDFVSVRDVVQANLMAMERGEADGMALNIGSGKPISIRDIALILGEELGSGVVANVSGKYRAGDIRHCYADISLASQTLGYRPKFEFSSGVRELGEWLKSQTAQDRASEAVEQLNVYGLTA